MDTLNIKGKTHLLELIEMWNAEGILEGELLADVLLRNYVFDNSVIPNLSKRDIFYECMQIYCDQARKGAIHSKWCIAQHLMTSVTYLWANPILAKLLVELAAYENEPRACEYMANKYLEFGNEDIAIFWRKKGEIGYVKKVVGEPVDLVLDRDIRTIYLN